MDLKILIVLVGLVSVFGADAATLEVSRQKRDDGVNIVQVILKFQQLLSSCKKPNPPETAKNQTNKIAQFVEEHDMQCLFSGLQKIIEELTPHQNSRRKRDTTTVLMDFLELKNNIDQCKKSNSPPSNSTNIIEKVMHDYDMGCLVKTVFEFVKKVIADSNQHQNTRRKRDTSTMIMDLLQLKDNIQKCKKSNPPPTNSTNMLEKIMNDYDVGCLANTVMEFVKKIAQDSQNKSSRRKRDTSNMLMDLLQLKDDVEKCKKSNPPPTNTTNMLEKIMNDYDMGCLVNTIMDFVKKVAQNSENKRSKRALGISDAMCYITKFINTQSKIEEIVKAYSPTRAPRRTKRAAASSQICDDFGKAVDDILDLVLDFAPNQPAKASSNSNFI